MKHPGYTARCLALTKDLLLDDALDVKRAVSFAIRLAARGDIIEVREFLETQVPPENPAATWVLCDVIRSMTKVFLPEFKSLLPMYESWAADPDLTPKDRRSIDSAIGTLKKSLMKS
jgi:hypothetical protein